MHHGNKSGPKAVFGLGILYCMAVAALSFGGVFLAFSHTAVVDTAVSWFFILPWPSDVVAVDPVCFLSGMAVEIAGCLLLHRWHSAVRSKNEGAQSAGGRTVLLVLSVIFCLLAESAAYVLRLFDAQVRHGAFFVSVGFFTVPIIMIILFFRKPVHS
ncbi:MAG: hypothetical protein K6E92_06810 [Lachnospiraceae bacterium]|nr:hypothetical protein [Lachnospiraceae bacterium]